jgi:hypothetical protein
LEQAERQSIQARRRRIAQYKHQYLMTDVIADEEPATITTTSPT